MKIIPLAACFSSASLLAVGALAQVAPAPASPAAQIAPAPEVAAPPPTAPAPAAQPAAAPAPVSVPATAETSPATPSEDTTGALPETDPDDSFQADAAASGILVGEEAPKLELYGFADVSYFHPLGSEQNILRQYVAQNPTFFVGHLNLYLSSTLSENWRSLAEVRFVYSPTGDDDKQGTDGTFPVTDTTVADYAELQRPFQWGAIEILRVWLEYQAFDFLSIRAGQWLTPYGYWNDDHGSPTIIAVHKPFPISESMFPEHQTGLMAHGKYFIDSAAIGYAATLSNGRGAFSTVRDLDDNKAIGGRLYVETSALGNLTVGLTAYRGRYTASTKHYRVNTDGPEPVAELYRVRDSVYDELSLGADARWLWKGLHLQCEVMSNEAVYDDDARPRVIGFDPRPTFAADYRRLGGYLLAGYRTPWIGLMPYAMWEHSSYTHSDFVPPMSGWTAGLNARPTPNVVLKAEFSAAVFDGVGSTGLGTDGFQYVGTQAAWAF
jgi:hypothetical protein